MVSPINGADEFNKLNKVPSMNDFMNSYKNNLNELDNPGDFMSMDALSSPLKGGVSKTQLAQDPQLMQDLNSLTNKNFNVNDLGQLSQNNNSADKTAKAFSKIMNDYVTDVNNKQHSADNAAETFASGGDIDMHSVMIASEKASTSMQLTLQLRNKLLSAYQEISRMQI